MRSLKVLRPTLFWLPGTGAATLILLAAGVVPGGAPPAPGDRVVLPDPLPVRRLQVSPEQMQGFLKQFPGGVFKELPRAEFEGRMQAAAEALRAKQQPPRLLKAHYRGKLVGTALAGQGTWTVVNPETGRGVLNLKDTRLAFRNVKIAGKPAVTGSFEGGKQGLLVPAGPGQHVVEFEWSVGGVASGELYYDFESPPCPATTLDLQAPEDHLLESSGAGVLTTGPGPAANGVRSWQLTLSGKKAALKFFPVKGPKATEPLRLVQIKCKQTLWPNRLEAEYTVRVEALHGVVQELVFDWNFAALPAKVSCPKGELKDWEVVDVPPGVGPAGAKPGGKALVVRFNEPKRLELPPVRVVFEIPFHPGQQWASPGLSLRGGVPLAETLALHLHSDLHLDQWQPGSFVLVNAEKDAAGFDTLLLERNMAAPLQRPAAHVPLQRPNALVKQATWWHIGAGDSTLTAQWTYQVNQGQFHQLAVALPKNWNAGGQVQTVEVTPKAMVRKFAVAGEGGEPKLVVDLQRGLAAGDETVTLKVGLRLPHAAGAGAHTVDFPSLRALGPVSIQGSLGVSVDADVLAKVIKCSEAASVADQAGPWGTTPLNFFYTFRDRPPTGQVHLEPQKPQLQASCVTRVTLSPGKADVLARLHLKPGAGATSALDLWVSAPLSGKLQPIPGDAAKITSVERIYADEASTYLSALAPRDPFAALALLGALPRGEWWRIKLAAGTAESQTLSLHAPFAPSASAAGGAEPVAEWEVPIFNLKGAASPARSVDLDAVGLRLTDWHAVGLQRAAGTSGAAEVIDSGKPHHAFIDDGSPDHLRRLWVQTAAHSQVKVAPRDQFDQARLVTYAGPDGQLTHRFTFRASDWSATTLPLELPGADRLLYARRDGKWMTPAAAADADGLRLQLPADPDARNQWFEVAYTTRPAATPWLLWTGIAVAPPRLPSAPLHLTHLWKLPPGVVPLDQRRCLPLLATGGAVAAPAWWFAAERLDSAWRGAPAHGWETVQRQDLQEALEQSRADKGAAGRTLGQALLALQRHLPSRTPLILDAEALRAAKISQHSIIPAAGDGPFWEKLGLADVPVNGGALLTSKERARWYLQADPAPAESESPTALAVAAAARHGRDASGQFQTVWSWLGGSDDLAAGPAAELVGSADDPEWTQWQMRPGGDAGDGIILVRQSNLRLLGGVLAVLVAVVVWRLGRHLPLAWKFRLLLLWAGLGGACLAVLPTAVASAASWPVMVGLAFALGNFFVPGAARGTGRRATLATGAALSVLAISFLLVPAGAVGQGKGFTVFVTGPADRQQVLVPVALLDELDQVHKTAAPRMPDAILVSANYDGVVKGGWAEIQAEFQVYCFRDEANVLLPLKGAQLLPDRDSKVEKATVYPLPVGDQAGYSVAVRGHKDRLVKLTLAFRTAVHDRDALREIQCGVPRLLQSRLTLSVAGEVRGLRAATALGGQLATHQGGNSRLEADLGTADAGGLADGRLWVRWVKLSADKHAPEPTVVEHHLGDVRPLELRPDATGLVSVLRYDVRQGSVSRFELLLPKQLQPRGVEVRLPEAKASLPLPSRLQGWKVTEQQGKRILTVDLDAPVTGVVQLTLTFVPSYAGGKAIPPLQLPTPLHARSTGGVIGYLASGPTLPDKSPDLSITAIDPAAFAKQWLDLRMPNPGAPKRAYRFQRHDAKGLAELRIEPVTAEPRLAQDIEWVLHPNYAEVNATVTIADAAETTYLEWEAPAAVTVANVAGPAVLRWSSAVAGPKRILQIWLMNPGPTTTLQLTGWLGQAVKPGPFALPRLAPTRTAAIATTVHVQAVKGLALRPLKAEHMSLAADAGRITYQAKQANYAATLQVDAAPVPPEVQIVTVAERHDQGVRVTAHIDCTIPVGDLPSLTLIGRGWQAAEPRLEAPRTRSVERQQQGQDFVWKLSLLPGTAQRFSVKLSADFPLPATGDFEMPSVDVAGAWVTRRWLAVAGTQLRPDKMRGLAPAAEPIKELTTWPTLAERIRQHGQLWLIDNKDWQLSLRHGGGKKIVQLLSAEMTASLSDTLGWVYEADYALVAHEKTGVHLTLPPEARQLGVVLDGKQGLVGSVAADASHLSLVVNAGVRRLVVRWTYPGRGAASAPDLRLPRFQDADEADAIVTVLLPPGYQAEDAGWPEGIQSLSPAAAWLHRAAGHLRRSAALAAGASARHTAELEQAQQSFYWCLAQAKQASAAAPVGSGSAGPEQPAPEEWRGQLEAENRRLAKKYHFEALRQQAERQPIPTAPTDGVAPALAGRGIPAHWLVRTATPPHEWRLSFVRQRAAANVSHLVQFLLVALLVGIMLSFVPGSVRLVRALWPEELFALALLATLTFGVSVIAIGLLGGAAGARLLWCVRRVDRLLRRPAATTASSS